MDIFAIFLSLLLANSKPVDVPKVIADNCEYEGTITVAGNVKLDVFNCVKAPT